MKVRENSNSQGRPFCGIRSCVQFVEEAEGILVGLLQNGNNIFHMGGEGA